MRIPMARSPSARTPRPVSTRLLLMAAAGVLLSGLCVWVLGQATDVSKLMGLIRNADLALLGAAVVSLAASMVVRSARWRVIMPPRPSGVNVGVLNTLPIVLAGYAGNALLPARLGDAARGLIAARRFRLGLPESLGSVGLERVVDAAALAAVALLASIGAVVPGWLTLASLLLLVAAAAFFVLLHWGRPIVRPLGFGRYPLLFLVRLATGLRARPQAVAASLCLSAVAWCLDGLTFWLGAGAIGLSIGWEIGLLIAAGAAVGSILPSAPAAIGTFELAGTAVGTALGLEPTTALGIVVVGHAITVVPLVAAGFVSAAWLGLDMSYLRTTSGLAARSDIARVPVRAGR